MTEIFGGPEMKMCRGVGIHTHPFLAADGFGVCDGCYGVVCQHCKMNIEANPYCLPCYAQEKLVPMAGEETGEPVNQMQKELANNYNFDRVDELTIKEVEDFYQQAKNSVADIIYLGETEKT